MAREGGRWCADVAFVIATNARSTSAISATAQPGPYDVRGGGMSRLVPVAGAQRCIREAVQIDVVPLGVPLEVRDQSDHPGIRPFTELRESSLGIGEIFDSEPPRECLTYGLVGVHLYAYGHDDDGKFGPRRRRRLLELEDEALGQSPRLLPFSSLAVSEDLVVKSGFADWSSRSGSGRRGSRRRIGLFTLHVPEVLDIVDELKRAKIFREVLAGTT